MKKILLTTLGLISSLLLFNPTDSKAATVKTKEKTNLSIETVKSWDRWRNFNYTKSLGKSKGLYTAKYKYKLNNGKTYYSLYRNGEWQGYTNIGAFKEIKWNNVKDYLAYATVDFTTFGNKELNTKKTKIKKQSIPLVVKGYYSINNKKYISLYSTSDVWLGYIEENKVQKPQWINISDKKILIKNHLKKYRSMLDLIYDKNETPIKGNVIVKGYYKLGSTGTVASLYDFNNNWLGYVYGNQLKQNSSIIIEEKPNDNPPIEEGDSNGLYLLNQNDMYRARSVLTIGKEIYYNKELNLENTLSFNQFETYLFKLEDMVQRADDYYGGQKADFTNKELIETTNIVKNNMEKLVLNPIIMKEALSEYKGLNEELKKKAQNFIDKQNMRLPQYWREYYSTVKQLKENK